MSKKEPLPVPPWETDVKVEYASDMFITLKNGTLEIHVDWDGTWWGSRDSSKEIADYMDLDKGMTATIQSDWEEGGRHEGFYDFCRKWLKGTLVPVDKKIGPKDWVPRGKKSEMRRFGHVLGPDAGGYGSENTYNLDGTYFWGDTFEYTHFLTTDDDDEGAIILWHGSPPEVWMGDFGQFISSQDEGDPKSSEAFLHWNGIFGNTILWAFDELGLFEGRVHMMPKFGGELEPVSHEPPEQIVKAAEEDSGILYPSLVEKILEHRDVLPKELVLTAGTVMDRWRREIEEEAGQKRFWERPEIEEEAGRERPE